MDRWVNTPLLSQKLVVPDTKSMDDVASFCLTNWLQRRQVMKSERVEENEKKSRSLKSQGHLETAK